jgi:hypothetical protein
MSSGTLMTLINIGKKQVAYVKLDSCTANTERSTSQPKRLTKAEKDPKIDQP